MVTSFKLLNQSPEAGGHGPRNPADAGAREDAQQPQDFGACTVPFKRFRVSGKAFIVRYKRFRSSGLRSLGIWGLGV